MHNAKRKMHKLYNTTLSTQIWGPLMFEYEVYSPIVVVTCLPTTKIIMLIGVNGQSNVLSQP